MNKLRFHKYIAWSRTAAVLFCMLLCMSGCRRYEPAALDPDFDPEAMIETTAIEVTEPETVEEETLPAETEPEVAEEPDTRTPQKVKGVYLASKPLASETFMETIWDHLDQTELNAVVIDIKDDYGRITYDMQNCPIVDELGSVAVTIEDLPALIKKFEEHNIYTIARIVSMRDPYIGKTRPEWCLTRPDGTVYTDNSGYTWINPYKTEYWDYLVAIGRECAKVGFKEVQFDYIRFCTDKGANDCVFDEDEVLGRDKISIITEAAQYLSSALKAEGLYVSLDVFGTIIGSQIDSRSVGQSYSQLAANVDYMCPMIYPSHYSAGNFGLDMPDKHPYEAILGALKRSRNDLARAHSGDGDKQAQVRPWLQSFTASWLGGGNYISYGPDEVRKEIQAVYDAGYDEWILWSASVNYAYEGLLSPAQAEAETVRIAESRAALPPEETGSELVETFPVELQEALEGDDLSEEDKLILEQDGPLISYE